MINYYSLSEIPTLALPGSLLQIHKIHVLSVQPSYLNLLFLNIINL